MTVTELAMIEPYGDVMYADPGYRDDRKRYPINTKAHVRAAWAYINMPKNSGKYTSEQLDLIKGRIKAAAARHGIEIAEDNPHTGPSAMGLENPYQSTILAGAAPLAPPAAWFTNPGLSAPTKLTKGSNLVICVVVPRSLSGIHPGIPLLRQIPATLAL